MEIFEWRRGERIKIIVRARDDEDDPIDLALFPKRTFCLVTGDSSVVVTEDASAAGSVITLVGDPLIGKMQVDIFPIDSDDVEASETVLYTPVVKLSSDNDEDVKYLDLEGKLAIKVVSPNCPPVT